MKRKGLGDYENKQGSKSSMPSQYVQAPLSYTYYNMPCENEITPPTAYLKRMMAKFKLSASQEHQYTPSSKRITPLDAQFMLSIIGYRPQGELPSGI